MHDNTKITQEYCNCVITNETNVYAILQYLSSLSASYICTIYIATDVEINGVVFPSKVLSRLNAHNFVTCNSDYKIIMHTVHTHVCTHTCTNILILAIWIDLYNSSYIQCI